MSKNEKAFDAVRFMRLQREKLSKKLANMTKEEIISYFRERANQGLIKPIS